MATSSGTHVNDQSSMLPPRQQPRSGGGGVRTSLSLVALDARGSPNLHERGSNSDQVRESPSESTSSREKEKEKERENGFTEQSVILIQHVSSSDSDDEGNSMKRKKVPYSAAECEILVKCWIDISINSRVENAQKIDQMWTRISSIYNKNRPANTPERHRSSLKTHFYKLQKQTKWFSECHDRMAKKWGSGKSEVDIIEMAHEEYKQHHGVQGFKYIGVWRILTGCPKLVVVDSDVQATKKTKIFGGEAHTFSSNTSSSGNGDAETEPIRSIGQKTAKQDADGKRKPNDFAKTKEVIEAKDAISARLAKIEEYKILMKDTSNMTLEQLQIHKMMCDGIKKEWGILCSSLPS